MDKHLKSHIEYLLCVNIESVRSVSGGDISKAHLLVTESERFFCKINRGDQAFDMFSAEKSGLEAIAGTQTIAAPKVLLCEALEKGGLLLMEYIQPKRASSDDLTRFGHELAALHQQLSISHQQQSGSDRKQPASNEQQSEPGRQLPTANEQPPDPNRRQPAANEQLTPQRQTTSNRAFGWDEDNFIGSLPQSNKVHTDWPEFYVAERLLPQLRMAQNGKRLQSHEIPSEDKLLETCENLIPDVRPSLLHGDLWSGNYLISQKGKPYLIDPATYYGHHEVDIAMTRLFGGFGTEFYNAYTESFPKIGGETEQNDIYQLYYLLVHLNLFGGSYKASVTNILGRYFLIEHIWTFFTCEFLGSKQKV